MDNHRETIGKWWFLMGLCMVLPSGSLTQLWQLWLWKMDHLCDLPTQIITQIMIFHSYAKIPKGKHCRAPEKLPWSKCQLSIVGDMHFKLTARLITVGNNCGCSRTVISGMIRTCQEGPKVKKGTAAKDMPMCYNTMKGITKKKTHDSTITLPFPQTYG